MSQAQQEMDEAVADWLKAYENHKRYSVPLYIMASVRCDHYTM
jgi:hypothetical protein